MNVRDKIQTCIYPIPSRSAALPFHFKNVLCLLTLKHFSVSEDKTKTKAKPGNKGTQSVWFEATASSWFLFSYGLSVIESIFTLL